MNEEFLLELADKLGPELFVVALILMCVYRYLGIVRCKKRLGQKKALSEQEGANANHQIKSPNSSNSRSKESG